MEAQKEILELTRELEHAVFLYYVKDAPEMTDYDYDRKLRRLEELEAQYPELPTRRAASCWSLWQTAFTSMKTPQAF